MSSERQADNTDSPWWGEHLHRYRVASETIKPGATVLDLACGEGFGTNYITQHCKPQKAIGGDLSTEAIGLCTKKYPEPAFMIMDGTATGQPDAFFSDIISFETIEHTTQYREMVREFFRILKPGGHLYLSTPNILVNSPDGVVRNPYHTQEFNYEELKTILSAVFTSFTIYGQQYIRYKRKRSFGSRLARPLEYFFYLRLIRKTPLGFKNAIFRMLIGKNFYPSDNDYTMTDIPDEILKCKTFFAVCRKSL